VSARILFSLDFNAVDGAGNSYVKYRAGQDYEVTEETVRMVAAGIAQTLDTPAVTAPLAVPVATPSGPVVE
jgi:hypothetical protein